MMLMAPSLSAKTILEEDFHDFFPPEIFKNFTPGIQSFVSNLALFDFGIFDFDKTIPENDEIIEIKYVYFPNFLPPLANQDESEEGTYRYTNNYSMRFFRSENSTIAIHVDPNSTLTKTYLDERYLRQCKFDSENRIFDQLVWDAKGENKLKHINYFYQDENPGVCEYTVEKNFADKKWILTYFNENGLVSLIKDYEFTKSDEESQDFEDFPNFGLRKPTSSRSWIYDDDSNVIQSSVKKGNHSVTVKNDYSNGFSHPDRILEEDGKIKSTTKYFSDVDYVMEVYLEDGFSVKSEYRDNRFVRNRYYRNGELYQRRGE
ncbi:MAG: hypothetical protein K6G52_02450 [Treponemataceae bacterium]|nr:hypothetical protein [Treponemataceae bacterium]